MRRPDTQIDSEIRGDEPVEIGDLTVPRWLAHRREASGSSAVVSVHREQHDEQRDHNQWVGVSWDRFADQIHSLAAGLIFQGVQRGDQIVVMAPTSANWARVDLAVMCAGAITVPIQESSSRNQVQAILQQLTPRLVFAGAEQLDRARELSEGVEVRELSDQVLADLARQESESDESWLELEARSATGGIGPDDVATIVFTSGTTGDPKGVPLTHRQLIWTTRQISKHLDDALVGGSSTLLFLPLAHIFARVVMFAALDSGVELGFARSVRTIAEDLRSYRPTFLLVVPRLLDRILSGGRAKATGWRRPVFDWGLRTSRHWSETEHPGPAQRARYTVANRLVLNQLRQALGGRVRYAVSGGARLDPGLGHTIAGLGIQVLEGYGMTETTAPVTVNSPRANRIGTVGRPLPGLQVRISNDREILVRGPSVMSGYLSSEGQPPADDRREDPTGETFTNGWLRTGDQGWITDDGYLVVHSRTKEIIVTDTGENLAPSPLEDKLTEEPMIAQAMLVGDDRPFVAALVTLDPDQAPDDEDRRQRCVQRAVDRVNETVGRSQSIKRFRILDREFSEDNDELTPTLKLRRDQILEHFADDVEALYREQRRR